MSTQGFTVNDQLCGTYTSAQSGNLYANGVAGGWFAPPRPTDAQRAEAGQNATEAGAFAASLTPGLETGDDLATFFGGCGYVCQAGGEKDTGWDRGFAAVGLLLPIGGKMIKGGVGIVGDIARKVLKIGCSFSDDTLISAEDGFIPISQVEEGMLVWAYNEATGEIGLYPVTDIFKHYDLQIVYLMINGEMVVTTPEHPFYTAEGEWIEAGNLEAGDEIRTADWALGEVENTKTVTNPQWMYNFTVDTAHTYFVGEEEWLVHNKCKFGLQKMAGATGSDVLSKGWHFNSTVGELSLNPTVVDGTLSVSVVTAHGGHAVDDKVATAAINYVTNNKSKVRAQLNGIITNHSGNPNYAGRVQEAQTLLQWLGN